MAYTFADEPKPVSTRNTSRRRRESGTGTTYTFDDSNALFQTAQEFNDGNSLTYSASSSQAGESTDSSVLDIEFLKMVEKDQLHHQQSFYTKQADRSGGQHQNFFRESSTPETYTGYSTDEPDTDYSYDAQMHHRVYKRQSGRSSNRSMRGQISSGQPSSSHIRDGGRHPRGHVVVSNKPHRSTPNSRKTTSDFSSPTMVSTDISNGSAHTPPPRHVKRISDDSEVWYQKWWMCGFTDAFSS